VGSYLPLRASRRPSSVSAALRSSGLPLVPSSNSTPALAMVTMGMAWWYRAYLNEQMPEARRTVQVRGVGVAGQAGGAVGRP
jgi:hypothetical protein